MPDKYRLNIVDGKDNIIDVETRDNIHKQGLLHREIHVWFYTSKGQIVFQHRAKDKDIFPDLLDATVGGHVEIGENYQDTALKEIKEETGIKTTKNYLVMIQMMKNKSHDQVTGMINNTIRAVYAFRYDNRIKSLKVEKNKALGFEAWPIEKLLNISKTDKRYFIPAIFDRKIINIFKKIKKLL